MIDRQTDRQSGLPLKARLFMFLRGSNTQEATGPRGDRERETDGHTDRQAHRQTHRQTGNHTDRWHTDRHTDRQAITRTDR